MTTATSKPPRRGRWWNRPRFDVFETALITIGLTVIAVYTIGVIPKNAEELAIAAQYGPSRHTEGPEEWVIRDFFSDRRDGFFVDVGANDYRKWSKTYYLETALGWSGLAVEPQQVFAADYAAHRPRTKFLPFFVSDTSNEQAKMYVLTNNRTVTSGNRAFVEQFGSNPEEQTATTITLNDLFEAENVQRVDFLNIDIELWEPKALAGLDLNRYRPELVCIEALLPVRQFILDHFTRHGYVVIGKYLRADEQNLYLTPLPPAS
jgi:FkbM family methyltransferase